MNRLGAESFLKNPDHELWDKGGEDVPISASDIKDTCDALDVTLKNITEIFETSDGSFHSWEAHMFDSHFRGWLVPAPTDGKTDIIIAKATHPKWFGYVLIEKDYGFAKEFSAKDETVNVEPFVSQLFLFTESARESFGAAQRIRIENMPKPQSLKEPTVDNQRSGEVDGNKFGDTIENFNSFSMYGLLKVNELMRELHSRVHLA